MTKKYLIAQTPQEKGYYIAGFIDGEGSFYLATRPRKDYPTGWKFSAHFSVSNKDKRVLLICKKYLGCGEIRETRPGFYCLEVSDINKLQDSIIPFFSRFGFLSNKKKYEFVIFRRVVDRIQLGIKTESDLLKFFLLRKQINRFRTERLTHTDEIIKESFTCSPGLIPQDINFPPEN